MAKIGGFVKSLMNPQTAITLMLGFIFLGVGLGLIAPLFLTNGAVANEVNKVFADANVTATTGLGSSTASTLGGLVFIVFPLVVIAGIIFLLMKNK